MKDLFEDDEIELEDAVEIMPENEASQQVALNYGNIKECFPLKILESGEELIFMEYSDIIEVCKVKNTGKTDRKGRTDYRFHAIARARIEPNGELQTVFRIEADYRNLKIGDFLIKTAIQKYGCWWLWCNGDRAYKIYRKYGLLPIYNGLIRPHGEKIDFKGHYKALLNGEPDPETGLEAEVFRAITMCDKAHLSEFGLEWSKELEEFVKYMDANYKGENYFGDSKKTYRYEFVEDTIEVIPSDKEETEIWGDFTTLKVKETDEELYVFDKPDEIEVCKKNGNSFKRIAHIKITDGYIHDFRIEDEKYKGYKLGNYLFKRAVEDYGGWKLDCGGTIAYKLYRKYDFIPIAPRAIGISKALATIYKRDMKTCLEEQKDVSRIIPMIRKDHLSDIGLEWDDLLKKFAEYVDTGYKGVYDSGRYVFERVDE